MFEELVEDTCCTAGGSNSANGEMESADIWVRGAVTRIPRKVQLCARFDSWALEVDPPAECFDKIPAISVLHCGFNTPREVPECSVYVVLKQYAIFNNVDVLEYILIFIVTGEYLDVLPK